MHELISVNSKMEKCVTAVRLVTFDVTNTLLKFRQAPGQQYALAGRAHGLRLRTTEQQLSADFRTHYRAMSVQYPNFGRSTMSWQDWWLRLVRLTFRDHLPPGPGLLRVDDVAARLIDEYRHESSWQVACGTEELLRHLRSCGVTLAVISNFDPRVHEILDNVRLRNYFDFVVTSYEAGYSKPDTRIFKEALERAGNGVAAHSALHVGDNLQLDYLGARRAGWNALLVNSELTKEDAVHVHSNHLYDELKSLKDAIVLNKTEFSFVNEKSGI